MSANVRVVPRLRPLILSLAVATVLAAASVSGATAHVAHATRNCTVLAGGEERAVFDAEVISAARDEVPYARLRSGITYELADPDAVLARWRATIDALR